MKIIEGDLIKLALDGEFDVIIHGCNCFNHMGGGIAKIIKNTFPLAEKVDNKTEEGDFDKLGTYSLSFHECENQKRVFCIVNAYTQYNPGPDVNYAAIEKCFKKIRFDFVKDFNKDLKFAYPKIGAGIAGGDWTIISQIIDDAFHDLDHTLVVLP